MKDTPSKTPLPQKLGIKSETHLALIAAPEGFDLPLDVAFKDIATALTPATTLALCFVRSLEDLVSTLDMLDARLPRRASVWIVHRKSAGKRRASFNQNDVRDRALAAGLVDYKVCSVSEQWSGVKFAWRKREGELSVDM